MTITIRQAGPGDEAAIVRLTQEMATGEDDVSPICEHYARHFLASPASGVLLAEDDGEAVGLLSYALVPGLYHAADSGLIELLIVTGTRRGVGIGRRLIDAALRVFRDGGCAEASVSTGEENQAGQKVYRHAGFTESSPPGVATSVDRLRCRLCWCEDAGDHRPNEAGGTRHDSIATPRPDGRPGRHDDGAGDRADVVAVAATSQ